MRFLLALPLLLAHCGSADRTTVTPIAVAGTGGTASDAGTSGTAGTSGASGTAGAAGSPGPVYTADNVCDLLPQQMCEVREGCCRASGVGFEKFRCQVEVYDKCKQNMFFVLDGSMTLQAQYIPDCLAEWQRLGDICDSSLLDWDEVTGPLSACRNIFRGNRGEGATCGYDEQCAPVPNALSQCVGQLCKTVRPALPTQKCRADSPIGFACADGAYCRDEFPYDGICYPTAGSGHSCIKQPSGKSNCESGDYCKDGSCLPRKLAGELCTAKEECRSGLCYTGVCLQSGSLFSQKECGRQ